MQSHDQKAAIEEDARQPNSEKLCGFLELLAVFLPSMGARVIAIEAVSIAFWILPVIWLNFTGSAEIDLVLALVSGAFIAVLTLLLVLTSVAIDNSVGGGSLARSRSRAVPALLGPARNDTSRPVARPSCLAWDTGRRALGARSTAGQVTF